MMYVSIIMDWKVYYYTDKNGNCSVQDFIDSRNRNHNSKIKSIVKQLEIDGPNLPRPYADYLRDGIHELRIKLTGSENRILYFFCFQDYIILTHSFIKNENEVPDREINKAIKIREDFKDRYPTKTKFEKSIT